MSLEPGAASFLPVSAACMSGRGWDGYDFLLVTGDAYVDHPSFGAAVIGRVLEAAGYRAAVLAQPDFTSPDAFSAMGRPRLAVLITAGSIDSMVAHYTAAKKPRRQDDYSPDRRAGLRPDRAALVYAHRAREAFPGLPLILGGLEASLRRFAHYDYWDDKVRRSYLVDARADLLVCGMGERAILEIARGLRDGARIDALRGIRGICYRAPASAAIDGKTPDGAFDAVTCEPYERAAASKTAFARAFMTQYDNQDAASGLAVIQRHGDTIVVQTPPAPPLNTEQLDAVADLPYTRAAHPMYPGGIKAVEEVRFSVIHNRGCFGSCSFCSIAFHQGRVVSARSHGSVLGEARVIAALPDFKGYIHDVGGPTANFRRPSCGKKTGMCRRRLCLTPEPCPRLDRDGSDYLELLRKLRRVPGVKKVFIRSGLRYDHLLLDTSAALLDELVKHHVSGQLKVAPEHCRDAVLDLMGKPRWAVYERFQKRFDALNKKYGKEQYLVPYLISSHPGCTLSDAVEMAETLNRTGRCPEQVQDFYPTPGTLSTCMYHTGLDPRTMKPVYVPRSPREKAMQRALLQWRLPQNRALVMSALRQTGRMDLVGHGPHCLLRPERPPGYKKPAPKEVKPHGTRKKRNGGR